jgi:hypothetical protein
MLIISPHVTTAGATDFRSLRAIMAGPRFAGLAGEELAIAIWRLVLDKGEGFYHYCPALERGTGHFVYDPVKLFNAFGWSICGVTANTLALLYLAAGFADARVVSVRGHEATEVFYDGAWHLMDGDLQAYHRKHPPHQDTIASYADCLADPTLISRQQNPSDPYYLADRPPQAIAELYRVQPETMPAFADNSHTMDFVLRPGERLERSAEPDGRWIWFANCADFKARYPAEWSPDGPRERFAPHRRYGSGRWVYQPKLSDRWADFQAGALESHNLRATARGVEPAAAGPAGCTFEFNSPWPFAGRGGADGGLRPHDGCLVELRLWHRDERAHPRVMLAVDPDLPATEVWHSDRAGVHEVKLDLTARVVNAWCFRLGVRSEDGDRGSWVLQRLRVESHFMIAPASLGRLVEGDNDVALRFGDDDGLPTVRRLIETDFRRPDDVRAKTHRLANVRFEPETDDRIQPADPARPYEVVYRIDAPQHGRVQRVFVHNAVRGRDENDPVETRVRAEWSADEAGPWHPIYDLPVIVFPHRWHFAAEGQAVLDEPRASIFVRLTGWAGLKTVRIRTHCLDDRTASSPPPLVVTHEWKDAAGTAGRHVQRVESPTASHRYRITCGASPVLQRIVMEAPSLPKNV